jgi:predicted O-linked N-acetylglucosamine transferase (SPINDLY family)
MQQAASLYHTGQWARSEQLCKLILSTRTNYFDALNMSGIIAAQTGRMHEAAQLLGRAVLVRPNDASAQNNYGNVLLALGRADEALVSFSRALQLDSGYTEAHNNRGNALRELGRWVDALESYDRALGIRPDFAVAHNNRGLALYHLGRVHDSLESYERALRFAPEFADVHCNRGDALHALRRLDEAIRSYDRALAIAPDFSSAYNNRGAVLLDLHRPAEALESHDRALKLDPESAEAHNNRGNALQSLSRLPEAVESYERAIGIRGHFTAAFNNRGNALTRMNRLDDALDSFERALSLDPGYEWLYGTRLFMRARLCDWKNWAEERRALAAGIENGNRVVRPFDIQALTDSEALLRRAVEISVQSECPPNPALGPIQRRISSGKIRVGYFSADFRIHPVAILSAGLFAAHDRSRFEITAFSSGPNTQDEMRRRIEQAFDRFLDVRTKSDQEIALLARQLELDIAVDLSGLTEDARPGVFALRAAPAQVGLIGFPGTMTSELVDYLVADRTVIPEASRSHYGEKIIYMPHTYLVNDSTRLISDRQFSRAELGLPDTGFVFCCFNNSYKISPDVFDRWMRILARVAGSVLWLSGGPSKMTQNLRREAEARGVSAERLMFAPRTPSLPEHLARHRAAGLGLDTQPFNGHSTTIDALWAGLPVLACAGSTFPGRVAASLLGAIGLPELRAENQEHYEELAADLALHPERLEAIRRKLADHRLTTPLFDTLLYTRNLESAYTEIHRRSAGGLLPEDIHIDSVSGDLTGGAT